MGGQGPNIYRLPILPAAHHGLWSAFLVLLQFHDLLTGGGRRVPRDIPQRRLTPALPWDVSRTIQREERRAVTHGVRKDEGWTFERKQQHIAILGRADDGP
jgi:hypothetical protein